MDCPICTREINDTSQFCSNCDFEIMLIPEGASDEFKKYVEDRQKKHKEKYEELSEFKQGNQKLEEQISEEVNKNRDSEVLIKKQKEKIRELEGKVATTAEELERLNPYETKCMKLEEQISEEVNKNRDSEALIRKQKEKIRELEGKVATTAEELERLRSYETRCTELQQENNGLRKYSGLKELLTNIIVNLNGFSPELYDRYTRKYNEIIKSK